MNKTLSFSIIEDNKNFHSRSVKLKYKPTFLLFANKLSSILASCESLKIDQADFNTKNTESFIIVFK